MPWAELMLGIIAAGCGWLLGFTRGVRQSAKVIAETRTKLDAAFERIQALEIALRAAKAPPLDHAGAVRVLDGLSGDDQAPVAR